MTTEEYEAGYKAGYRAAEKWLLPLNRYQRDNLLQMLNLIGYPNVWDSTTRTSRNHIIEPFHILNSGDWVGEIAWMLSAHGTPAAFQLDAEKTGKPNLSREEIRRRVEAWTKTK